MAKQKIRFNYFEPQLVIENDELVKWDMKKFLDTILNNKRVFDSSEFLGDEVSDLEWNSCDYDDKNDLYYIQLSKLRSKNIPSRKRRNHDKEDIKLADDEYLGEFNLLIYDPKVKALITQGNFYGLTTKQMALTLTGLRRKVNDFNGETDGDLPYMVNLAPVIDLNAVDKVMGNEIYRKITIKGADFSEIADTDLNSQVLSKAIDALNQVHGVNFELTLSMAKSEKKETLEKNEIRSMIDDVRKLNEKDSSDVAMNIASRRDFESSMEYIDLLTPRLTSEIVLDVKNRSTIGAEYIFNGFKEQNYFDSKNHMQRNLIRLLPNEV
ncbi:DUF6731 family protein [Enterococcus dongliensis]|uniref:DUF6731 family protein n=1 Tax=Enterococcus dongliensis TaxID=2559925 RepID=UPI00288DADB8|nr:DUF6731 family protein [Enterococcus dongliensis]MDT2612788.1 hypothetical protein [Enterococcus dongliensis]